MKEWLPIIAYGVPIFAGGAWAVWAFVSGFRKRSEDANKAVDRANARVAEVIQLEADAWRKRYEGEHEEFVEYRDRAHLHNNETNTLVLKLTTENAELRSKTDLSPVLRFHQEQSDINSKIVGALDKIIRHLDLATGQQI